MIKKTEKEKGSNCGCTNNKKKKRKEAQKESRLCPVEDPPTTNHIGF